MTDLCKCYMDFNSCLVIVLLTSPAVNVAVMFTILCWELCHWVEDGEREATSYSQNDGDFSYLSPLPFQAQTKGAIWFAAQR